MEELGQAEDCTDMGVFRLTKVDLIRLNCDHHKTATADRRYFSICAECVEECRML